MHCATFGPRPAPQCSGDTPGVNTKMNFKIGKHLALQAGNKESEWAGRHLAVETTSTRVRVTPSDYDGRLTRVMMLRL